MTIVSYKSFDEALAIALAHLRMLYPGGDLTPHSPLYHRAVIWAAGRVLASNQARGRFDAIRTSTAMGVDLDSLGYIYDSPRKAATGSEGIMVEVPVTGANSWLATLVLSTTSGLTFNPRAGGSWTAADSYVYFLVDSNDTGYETNLPIGAELTITSPPSGMGSTATVYSLDQLYVPARDGEQDDEMQDRLTAALNGDPTSPSPLQYVEWLTDDDAKNYLIPTYDDPPVDAFVYPGARFDADVSAVPVLKWDGIQKRPSAAMITAIETYMGTVRPPDVDFDAVRFTEQSQTMGVTLDTDTGYGRDWGTSSVSKLTIDTASHTVNRAYLTTAPSTQNLDIGHHVLLFIGSNFFPNVRQVSGVSNATGDYYIDVAEPFVDEDDTQTAPTSARFVYNAGPITEAVIDKLSGIFAMMTPSDTSPTSRIPPPSQGYPEDITAAMIGRACLDASDRIYNVSIGVGPIAATTAAVAGGVLVAYVISPSRADGWVQVWFNNLN